MTTTGKGGSPGSGGSYTVVFAPRSAKLSGFSSHLATGVKGGLQTSMADVGHGLVVLRADAVTTWTRSRTPADRLPSGAARLTIVYRPWDLSEPPHRVTITDPTNVARVADLLDQLEPTPKGAYGCYGDNGAHYTLTFEANAGTTPEVTAVVKQNSCETKGVTISIGSGEPRDFGGNEALTALLKRLDP